MMRRVLALLAACSILPGCGGGSGAGGGSAAPVETSTVISELAVTSVASNTASLSFSITPSAQATVRVWLNGDDNAVPPRVSVVSANASNHTVALDDLWSATSWRVEVRAGNATTSTTFTTAEPGWPDTCRSGGVELPVDGAGSWSTYTDRDGSVSVEPTSGCNGVGDGARFTFNLGDGEWVVAASNDTFVSPVDLSDFTHLWVPFRGTEGIPVAFEVKLKDSAGALSVARMNGGAGVPGWRSWAVDKREFISQVGDLDFSQIVSLEFAFSWPASFGGNRRGSVDVGALSAWNIGDEKPVLTGVERLVPNDEALAAIAADLLARQQPHGFIPAWFELAPNWHLYANAMALIVFTLEYDRLDRIDDSSAGDYLDAANRMADKLVELQVLSGRDGAWDDSFRVVNGQLELFPDGARTVWVGSTAWAGIALIVASDLLPDGQRFEDAIEAASGYYRDEQQCRQTAGLPAGSVTEGSEGNISSHLFLEAAERRGLSSGADVAAMTAFIGETLFDSEQLRFFCGARMDFGRGFDRASCSLGGSGSVLGGDGRSCLDVTANWGVEWLRRQGRDEDALNGLAYSRFVYPTHAFDDADLRGLGDIAGPWTPTVEHGAGQWASAGGPDSNFVMQEAWTKLCTDGACRGAADDLTAGIGWNTVAHGIAPAAWMYIAWHGDFWSQL